MWFTSKVSYRHIISTDALSYSHVTCDPNKSLIQQLWSSEFRVVHFIYHLWASLVTLDQITLSLLSGILGRWLRRVWRARVYQLSNDFFVTDLCDDVTVYTSRERIRNNQFLYHWVVLFIRKCKSLSVSTGSQLWKLKTTSFTVEFRLMEEE